MKKDTPLVAVTSSSTINGESLNKNPLAIVNRVLDIVNRAKRAHAEKSNLSVSKRLIRNRFDLLHSVIAVRQLVGKPIDAEKYIPVDFFRNYEQLVSINLKKLCYKFTGKFRRKSRLNRTLALR
jgi:hypothetical protein